MAIDSYGTPDASYDTYFEVNDQQDQEKQELSRRVLNFYERTLKNMQKKHRLWKENYEFFLGRQWANPRPAYRSSEVLNYTFAAIESALPILTDNRPRFSFNPEDPNDGELATYFEKIATSMWHGLIVTGKRII